MIAARSLLTVAALALGMVGCCRVLLTPEESDERAPPTPSPTGPATELGVAVYPQSAQSAQPQLHTWSAKPLKPSTYRVGYALAREESSAVEAAFRSYARKVSYADEGSGKFRWSPPSGCSGDMHCIFEELVARNHADIVPLIERFRTRQREAKLSALDLTALVVTFVQAIKYQIPDKEPFGVLPPALVVAQSRGDCDSKSLLAHMILRALGVDSLLVSSMAHHHTMLGIALPVSGTKFTHAGRSYAFTEMTAKGSPLGHVNRDLLSPNDWKAVPFRYPGGGAPAVPAPPKSKGRR